MVVSDTLYAWHCETQILIRKLTTYINSSSRNLFSTKCCLCLNMASEKADKTNKSVSFHTKALRINMVQNRLEKNVRNLTIDSLTMIQILESGVIICRLISTTSRVPIPKFKRKDQETKHLHRIDILVNT